MDGRGRSGKRERTPTESCIRRCRRVLRGRRILRRLMDDVQKDLHRSLGLEQANLAHMRSDNPNRKLVQFRPVNVQDPIFRMDFGLDDSYKAVVGRVACKLNVSPEKIKLTPHNCSWNLPDYVYLEQDYQFDCLRDALVNPNKQAICDVLYYSVCDPTTPNSTKSETGEVAYGAYPNAEQVVEHA